MRVSITPCSNTQVYLHVDCTCTVAVDQRMDRRMSIIGTVRLLTTTGGLARLTINVHELRNSYIENTLLIIMPYILLIWGKYTWSYSKWPAVITYLLHHQTACFMNIHNCYYNIIIAGLPSMLAQQKQLQVQVYAM